MTRAPHLTWPCTLALALALGGASSCASEDPSPVDDSVDCAADLIGEWESSAEYGCPLVDPNCTYRLPLSFDGDDFEWMPSDQTYDGPYTCVDGEVEALDDADATVFTASYDVEADTLVLSGGGFVAEPYQRKAP